MNVTVNELSLGDPQAYSLLFDRLFEPLYRYAFTFLKSEDEAKEMTQRAFCKLWDMKDTIKITLSVDAYMYRMVHNDCLNLLQQRQRQLEHNYEYMLSRGLETPESSRSAEYSDLQKAMERALDKLPPKCREVFVLNRFHLLSNASIAERMEISVNTVENHMSKALRIMRLELKDFVSLSIVLSLLK